MVECDRQRSTLSTNLLQLQHCVVYLGERKERIEKGYMSRACQQPVGSILLHQRGGKNLNLRRRNDQKGGLQRWSDGKIFGHAIDCTRKFSSKHYRIQEQPDVAGGARCDGVDLCDRPAAFLSGLRGYVNEDSGVTDRGRGSSQ